MKYRSFVVAYTIVRGSVPVYWTQPGYKYRPPPVIENGTYILQSALMKFSSSTVLYIIFFNHCVMSLDEEETMEALKKHILQQINFYNELVCLFLSLW